MRITDEALLVPVALLLLVGVSDPPQAWRGILGLVGVIEPWVKSNPGAIAVYVTLGLIAFLCWLYRRHTQRNPVCRKCRRLVVCVVSGGKPASVPDCPAKQGDCGVLQVNS